MSQQTAVDWLVKEFGLEDFKATIMFAKAKEKEQMGYTEEQAYEIWKAGQKYWETSGSSITFEELIEKFKNK